MTELESARKRWLTDRPEYDLFSKELASKLRTELRREGIWAEVSGRAKEVDSLVRKLIKKPKHNYDSIGDKSGIRVILRYKDEIKLVSNLVEKLFKCGNWENKADTLKHDKVGYLSTHVDIKLREDDLLTEKYPPMKFQAELQLRTLAQHLWSEMSHDAFYKNDDTLNPLPIPIKRRVYILSGVVEVADDEFNRLNGEMPEIPELIILKSLERHYYKLTTRHADTELSLDVIRLLMLLYNDEAQKINLHLDNFYNDHQEVIYDVYEQAEDDPNRSAYLYQPEALMIYDRLDHDSVATRRLWNTQYPEGELERIANAFGISFD